MYLFFIFAVSSLLFSVYWFKTSKKSNEKFFAVFVLVSSLILTPLSVYFILYENDFSASAFLFILLISFLFLIISFIFCFIFTRKKIKKLENQNNFQNKKIEEYFKHSKTTEEIIFNLKKELSKNIIENKNIIASNNNAVEAIRKFYFEHTGNALRTINERPDRIELYIDKVLERINELTEKDCANFKSVPTYTCRVSEVYNVHLIQYSEYVKRKYEEKLYAVSAFDENGESYGFERYLFAENNLNILLIQCVLIEPELTLCKESVYAMYSTYYKLKKNVNKTTHLVIICNSTLSDETKDLARALKINYKERVCDPFLEPDSPETDI